VDYDRIGIGYAATRQSDPRIATAIRSALGDVRSVVNVGAGAGSYEPDDVRAVAVEPSEVMVRQRLPGSALSVRALAERLPFADGAFDASLATYTVHHWADLDRGLSELGRVARRRVVILMSDIEVEASFWLNADYFPAFTQLDRERLMAPGEVLGKLGGQGTITVVPVPWDCRDGFCSAFWRRPEAYLDPRVRAGVSYFSIIHEDVVAAGLKRLADDLASGAWDRRFGSLRQLDELDTGQRLIVAEV
jgi:SAM-dependent methyltransferase